MGEIESPGYPGMPKGPVTCKRVVPVARSNYVPHMIYRFIVYDMTSCKNAKLTVSRYTQIHPYGYGEQNV